MKRMICFFAAVWFFLMPAAFAEDTPCIAWMEYETHATTGQWVWQHVVFYQDGKERKELSLADDKEGFFLTCLENPSECCLAIHTIGSDVYTIHTLREGGLQPLFSVQCPDAFAFLGFWEQSVYYVQQSVDGMQKTFVLMEQTADTSREVIRYQSRYWYRPSINAKGDILYTVAREQDTTILLHTPQGDEKITNGEFPIWYGDDTFLYVLDQQLWLYDLSSMTASLWKDETGEGVQIALNPFSGDGLYLTADGQHVVFGKSVEEKYLGFISSGYYHKTWQVLSLLTGEVGRVGILPESYDNIHVH